MPGNGSGNYPETQKVNPRKELAIGVKTLFEAKKPFLALLLQESLYFPLPTVIKSVTSQFE